MQKEDEASIYHNSSSAQNSFAPNIVQNNENISLSSNVNKKENPAACVFVASLNKNIPDDELTANVFDHFKQWGNLLGVKVLKDWLKRPYAFVQYEFEEDSKYALQEAPGTYINGRSIRCEPARVNRSICLITFNRPFNKQFLHSQLSSFGEIEDITVLQPNGKFHYVFIKFKYRDDAIRSYLTLKGTDGGNRYSWFVEWASNLDVNNMYGGVYGTSFVNRYLDKSGIFVGNLYESITDEEVKEVFGQYGSIVSTHVVRKPYPHRKRVFAFIKYQNESEAASAIDHENGRSWNDKIIRVCYREYYHNPNAYTNTCYNNPPYHQSCGNNKYSTSYVNTMGPRKRGSRQQQQQIMTTPFMEEGSLFYTPYFNMNSPAASKSALLDNVSISSSSSAAPSSTENLLYNYDCKPAKNQGIIAAGAFYPMNDDNGLYNAPPYFIADPYTNTGGATGTAMVYYPYPVQPYFYGSNKANYSSRRKKNY